MKFQNIINKNVKAIGVLLFALSVLVSSCGKEDSTIIGTGKALLKVSLEGIDFGAEQSPLKLASINGKSTALETIQEASVPFNNEFTLVARLIAESPTTFRKDALVASAKATGVNRPIAATTPITSVLPNGTKYAVVAYDSDENYVDDVVYSVGSETTEEFALNAGETYTFIAFSTGSTTTTPTVNTSQTLSAATLTGVNGNENFMWYTKTMKLTHGVNKLDIVMKHRFSQITTVLNASAVGNITAIAANIRPHRATTDIKLSDGVVSYPGTAISKAVSFSGLPSNNVTSAPTIVAANTTAGIYTISSITVAGTTKTNVVLENLKITPGVRYRLVLNLTPSDDGGIDIGGSTWAPGNLIYTLNIPGNHAAGGVYGFAATNDAQGNYFFPNYVLPKRFDIGGEGNRNPTVPGGVNGGPGDPCKLVLPLNSWRLPTVTEFVNLGAATAVGGADNPGVPSAWDPARFQGNYNGTGRIGLFYGTQVSPGSNYENYLFLPYWGAYIDNNTGDGIITTNIRGLYLLSAANGYSILQITGVWDSNPNSSTDPKSAVQIRCVKNQ